MGLEVSSYANKKIRKSVRISRDPWIVEFRSTKKTRFERSIQSSMPIFPNEDPNTAYIEVTVLTCRPQTVISIGYATKPYPPFRMPGTELYSIAYKSSNGHKFSNDPYDGDVYGPIYGEKDVIGCGHTNLEAGFQTYFFTKNGVHLGNAVTTSELFGESYLCIGADGPCKLTVNFGETDFKYKSKVIDEPLNGNEVGLPCLVCHERIPEDKIDEHMDTHCLERPQRSDSTAGVLSNQQLLNQSSDLRASAELTRSFSGLPLPSYQAVTRHRDR